MRIQSGRSAAWLAHLTGGQGVGGSNPLAPIFARVQRSPNLPKVRRLFSFLRREFSDRARCFECVAPRLQVEDARVVAVLRQELLMRAELDDLARVQDDDA